MKTRQIYLDKYDWYVTMYYNVTCEDEEKIINELNFLEITESLKLKVKTNIRQCEKNIGFTYTNFNLNETVMVIGETSSTDQFLNSLTHETLHTCMHIMEAYNISPYGEDICYLAGHLIQEQADIVKEFVCKH